MTRLRGCRMLGILTAFLVAVAVSPGSTSAVQPDPKVVVIVGPVGSLTDTYRAIGARAATEARRWTSDVVTVFSPDATWPATRTALQGASLVIYLGHGNGWPSPYREALYPVTQDGLGLNPVAGVDDTAHQYFGEQFLASQVQLAPHAAVLLLHLCYASGNSEPGRAEPTLAVGQQRIDNFAAGWLAAGADAVIADTFAPPRPYVREMLGSDRSLVRIWRDSPTFHDHVTGFASVRTPGASALLDLNTRTTGFYRSLVVRNTALRAGDVVSGAAHLPGSPGPAGPTVASLAGSGVGFGSPELAPGSVSLPSLVAGTSASITLPVTLRSGARLPSDVELGVRWDPVALDSSTPTVPGASPRASASPVVPDATPPAIGLVVPESPGSLVTPVAATYADGRLSALVTLPGVAGRYRLVTTIHDRSGVAYDAATQALVPGLLVRVSRDVSVAFGVAPALTLTAGSRAELAIRVANDGSEAWMDGAPTPGVQGQGASPVPLVIARWVPLGETVDTSASISAADAPVAPGVQKIVELRLLVPDVPGDYLVVLELESPRFGSVTPVGGPATIQVHVEAVPTSQTKG